MRKTGGREGGRTGGRYGGSLPAAPSSRHPVLSKLRTTLKQIAGMPDYERYLEHAREYHPDCPLLSEREYYDQYIATRYAGGGSRCC